MNYVLKSCYACMENNVLAVDGLQNIIHNKFICDYQALGELAWLTEGVTKLEVLEAWTSAWFLLCKFAPRIFTGMTTIVCIYCTDSSSKRSKRFC